MAETAIAVEVPEAEPVVDLLRRQYTTDGAEGIPAHITLLYPFTDTDLLVAGRVNEVQAVIERFSAFDIELAEARRFTSEAETVLWLAPNPSGPFLAMIGALAAEFPEHPPFGGKFDPIVPHLTVAVSADPDLLGRIENEVLQALPIHARIEQAALYEHATNGWRLRSRFNLHTL